MNARTIIAECDMTGLYWTAWFDGQQPQEGFGGPGELPTKAVERLMKAHGLDPRTVEADTDNSRAGRVVFKLREQLDCPVCHGSRIYIGMWKVEPCPACGGSGRAT